MINLQLHLPARGQNTASAQYDPRFLDVILSLTPVRNTNRQLSDDPFVQVQYYGLITMGRTAI